MEAAYPTEALVTICKTTLFRIPEDSNLHRHRRENLKSHSFKMEAACPTEALVTICKTTLFRIPEDSNLHRHLRENLKSHSFKMEAACPTETLVTISKIALKTSSLTLLSNLVLNHAESSCSNVHSFAR
jgi:hypothetical protein